MGTITNGEFGYRVTALMRTPGRQAYAHAYEHWRNYQTEVAYRVEESNGLQIRDCAYCGQPTILVDRQDGLVVWGSGTTADGLTYCPPNPDHDGSFGSHRWVKED